MLVAGIGVAEGGDQLRREFGEQRRARGSEDRRVGQLQDGAAHSHPQIVMLSLRLRSGAVIVLMIVMMPMQHRSKIAAQRGPTVLHRQMHAGKKPRQQHKGCKKWARCFHNGDQGPSLKWRQVI